jgi:hypothetical protein
MEQDQWGKGRLAVEAKVMAVVEVDAPAQARAGFACVRLVN